MSTHAAFSDAWLAADNHKIILVELEYHDGESMKMFYFSNHPYTTSPGEAAINSLGEVLTNIAYEDILTNIPIITSSIDNSDAIGALDVLNTDGEFDELINFSWVGHTVRIYMGEPSWPRSAFGIILDGITSKITSTQQHKIIMEIRDKQEILNVPAQNDKITSSYVEDLLNAAAPTFVGDISGTRDTEDRAYSVPNRVIPEGVINNNIPICLGKVFNISPIMIDSFNHVYLIHEKSIKEVTEVRADGVALANNQYELALSIDNGDGVTGSAIRLLDHPHSTQITCDVVGCIDRGTGYLEDTTIVPYSTAHLVEWLVLEKTSLTNEDICYPCFDINGETPFANTYPLGLYVDPHTEPIVQELIKQIVSSSGGYHRINNISKLQIKVILEPKGLTPDFYISTDSVEQHGFTIGDMENPVNSMRFGYKKNWTIQDESSIAGTVVEAEDELNLVHSYTTEFSEVIGDNNTLFAEDQYPIPTDNELFPTLFWDVINTQTELVRRLAIRQKKRFVYKLKTTTSPFTYNIGDIVNIKYPRYGFKWGLEGMIIGMEQFPTKNRINLEVWL